MTDATIHTLKRPYTPHVVETVKPAPTLPELWGALSTAHQELGFALTVQTLGFDRERARLVAERMSDRLNDLIGMLSEPGEAA